jgi:thiosulfate/3-mercaptopyruvate sulfurtransferase
MTEGNVTSRDGSDPTGPLVSVGELVRLLGSNAPPLLLDVRWALSGPPPLDRYRAGHLPGAVFVDLDADLAGPPGPDGRHPLPEPGAAQAALRRLGVAQDVPVVVYDHGDATVAARAWWLLRYLGHRPVRVLDGGLAAWVAAGQPVEAGEPVDPRPGDLTVLPGSLPVVDAAGAARAAADGVLLDVRTPERYRGEQEPVDPVAGHVPGAVSAPAAGNVGADGRLLPADALGERFASLGVHPGGPVAAYCGSGVTAAQTVLALAVAGMPAALYVGSWSEWVADPARPVATGD